MPNREMVIKGLECCTEWDSCNKCPYETRNEYDIAECTLSLHKDALDLLKEQDAEERKWLQAIADTQLANAPNDSPMSLDEQLESEYKSGIYDGLQMAFEILTEGR